MSTYDMQAGGDNGVDSNTTLDALPPFDSSKSVVLEVRAAAGTPQAPLPGFSLVAITATGNRESPAIVACGGSGITPSNPPPGAPGIVGLAGSLAERLKDHLGGGDNAGIIGFGGDPTQDVSSEQIDLDFGIGVEGRSKSSSGVIGWSRYDFGVQGVSGKGAMPISSFALRAGVLGLASEAPSDSALKAVPVGVLGSGSTDDNASSAFGMVGVAGGASVSKQKSVGVIGMYSGAGAGIGVFASAVQNPPGPTEVGESFAIIADGQGGPAASFLGDVRVSGNFTVFGGQKNAAVPHPDGTHRVMSCMESPESWFEDFGEAQLVKGRAEVKLDPDFAALVHTHDYHVFVSAYGDSKGLYVSDRTKHGFIVRENQGGASNVGLSYRIAARRKDTPMHRLPKVEAPVGPSVWQDVGSRLGGRPKGKIV